MNYGKVSKRHLKMILSLESPFSSSFSLCLENMIDPISGKNQTNIGSNLKKKDERRRKESSASGYYIHILHLSKM